MGATLADLDALIEQMPRRLSLVRCDLCGQFVLCRDHPEHPEAILWSGCPRCHRYEDGLPPDDRESAI